MKHFLLLTVISLLFWSCQEQKDFSTVDPVNWKKRAIKDISVLDSLEQGTTYLSVYSEIYSLSEHRTHDLTATISLRNTHRSDSVFLTKAEYFNTEGDLIRTYFTDPIYLKPMETVEIVIDEIDKEGGTGGNFIFDWVVQPNSSEPLFEAVMISTSGQQGLSFTTVGKRLK